MVTLNDDDRAKRLFQYFCRHLVGLGMSYWVEPHTDEKPKFSLFSGTLITIGDIVFFLTAGHALQRLKSALSNPLFKKDAICLIDSFGPEPIDRHPIPFALNPDDLLFIDDSELGLDFGLGRVDGFNQHHRAGKADEGRVADVGLLAAHGDAFKALELADRLFNTCS